ncbi:hypothetical protein EHS43_15730 [Streptomyces sp. RP5T]|nr:hypothetical protein EHS43_15730 [Streptomyces sp. RP5T]
MTPGPRPGRVAKVPPASRRHARAPILEPAAQGSDGGPPSPHRAKAQVHPVRGLPPGTPRART